MAEQLDSVLKNCYGYDDIINYTPSENDNLSKNIIRFYQDYVFFNWNQVEKIKMIDEVVSEYIKNRNFYNFIHSKLENDFFATYDVLINLYSKYQNESVKTISSAKWL